MRKCLHAILICLILVGCSQPEEKQNDNSVNTIHKIDESKDYVYVEKTDEYNLRTILFEAGRSDDYDSAFLVDNDYRMPGLDLERGLSNELIRINIDSNDAKEVDAELVKVYEENFEIREGVKTSIQGEVLSFLWSSMSLYETYETTETISLSVYRDRFQFPGHSQNSFDSYVFSKETGALLDNQQVAQRAGSTLDKIIAVINEDFINTKIDHFGVMTQRHLEETMSQEQRNNLDELYYRIQPNHGIIITDTEVHVILQMYLGIDDDFTGICIYSILLETIR